jgi:hydroxypyruvate isomerase
MDLIANITLLFTELPLAQRFAAAARAGFDGVEIQFPYEADAAALRRAAGDLPIVLINVPAADGRGGNGLSTDAAQQGVFLRALDQAVRYAEILRVQKVNVLPGPPPAGQPPDVTDGTLVENVRLTARRMAEIGVRTLVEAVNPFDVPGFWLDGLHPALSFLDGLADPSVQLQFDFYHMARTEPDLPRAIERAGWRIGHVQFADHPGRHEPGSGEMDFAAAFAALRGVGYDGAVSAEYRPAGATTEGLAWLPRLREWLAAPASVG